MIKVEVVYALPERQWLIALEVDDDTTVADALRSSGLIEQQPMLAGRRLTLGVFGRIVAPEERLRHGDRVEVYRELQADPKETRRRLAAAGKAMGRRRPA